MDVFNMSSKWSREKNVTLICISFRGGVFLIQGKCVQKSQRAAHRFPVGRMLFRPAVEVKVF